MRKFFCTDIKFKLSVVFVVVVLIFISLWNLPHSPATWFDEGISVGIAASLVKNGVYSLQFSPTQFVIERSFLITNNYPVLLPVALMVKLFGTNFIAMRLPMIIFLWLFCYFTYVLARTFSSSRLAALFSVALVITFAPFYGNGKAVLGEVPGLVYFLAGLWCLYRAAGNFKRIFLAGLLLGLAAATKPFFLIVLPSLLVGEIYSYRKFGTPFWKRGLVLFLGVVSPLIIWFITIISPFSMSRLLDTFYFYSNSYVALDFGGLIVNNLFRFVSETTPFHFLILFTAVCGWFFLRIKKRQLTEIEVIVGVFIILNFLWYLKTPGWYRYLFTAHLLLFIFFPATMLAILKRKLAIVIVLVLVTTQAVHLVGQRHNPLYNSSDAAAFAKQTLAVVPEDASVFVLNSPSVSFLLDGRSIYQMLQINPVLFFGWNFLQDNTGTPFTYVITSGSLEGVKIPHLVETLNSEYKTALTVGHFILYQRE